MSENDISEADLLKIKEKYEEGLLEILGVTAVDYNGSIIVFVEKAEPKVVSFIPKTLEGVPVKIVQTGRIKPLSFPMVSATYGSRTDRIRPPIGGISVGHPKTTAGTLTCAVRDKRTGRMAEITNNHVGALQWGTMDIGKKGDPILQPGIYDGGNESTDIIGYLERWVKVELGKKNLIDGCVFNRGEGAGEIKEVGRPSNTIEAYTGMKLKKSGRSSGLTFTEALGTHSSVKVEGWGEALFVDQIICKPAFSVPGDSGSWVGNENNNTVGIVFAGSPEVTVVNKAINLEELLGIEFAPDIGYLPLSILAPVPATILGAFLTSRMGGER